MSYMTQATNMHKDKPLYCRSWKNLKIDHLIHVHNFIRCTGALADTEKIQANQRSKWMRDFYCCHSKLYDIDYQIQKVRRVTAHCAYGPPLKAFHRKVTWVAVWAQDSNHRARGRWVWDGAALARSAGEAASRATLTLGKICKKVSQVPCSSGLLLLGLIWKFQSVHRVHVPVNSAD